MIDPWRQKSGPRCAFFLAVAFVSVLAFATIMARPTPAYAAAGDGTSQGAARGIIGPAQAWAMSQAGQVMIIDIRRPDEWRKTGLPTGAKGATVNFSRGAAKFLKRIAKLTKGDKSQPIALICAAGVRSRHASRLLRNRGYTQVLDIGEGMLGSGRGPGWLRRKLPVSACGDC